jgi:hypothetical protein
MLNLHNIAESLCDQYEEAAGELYDAMCEWHQIMREEWPSAEEAAKTK